MQKQGNVWDGGGGGRRSSEAIPASERSACQAVAFPSYVLSAGSPCGAGWLCCSRPAEQCF